MSDEVAANANEPGPLTAEDFATLSDLVDRIAFARKHGLQYGDNRDIYQLAGYPVTISFEQYNAFYERDPIAGKVVDMPPETTWRKKPEIVESDMDDEEDKETEFTRAFDDMARRVKLWRQLEAADKLARVGQYSVVLLGFSGVDDQQLAQPLRPVGEGGRLMYLSVFSQKYAKIAEWVTDPGDERFGQPLSYAIDLSGDVATFRRQGSVPKVKVHHSRVIHIAEDALQNPVYGRPALQRIYNDLQDYLKVSASTAEAFWQRVAGVLQAILDKDADWDEDTLAALDERLQEVFHDLRNQVTIQGGRLERLGGDEPQPDGAAKLYERRIAAGAGIPVRMLIGSETGERASTEDQKAYFGMVAERQTTHAEDVILRPFIDTLIEANELPKPKKKDGYEIVWPTLFQEPEKDIAEANRSKADAAKALTPIGGDPMELVEIDKDRNILLKPKTADDPSPFEGIEPPGASLPFEPPAPPGPLDGDEGAQPAA